MWVVIKAVVPKLLAVGAVAWVGRFVVKIRKGRN
jgi:hypothetical protein